MKVFLLMSKMVLFCVLQLLVPYLRRINWPAIIAINAGSSSDAARYATSWVAKYTRKERFYPIGFYRISWRQFALVLGTPYSNMELKTNQTLMQSLVSDLSGWRAKRITLTGIMTAYSIRHDAFPEKDPRFTSGSYGTPLLIKINIEEIFDRHPELKSQPIGIIGFGFTGRKVAAYLSRFYEVRAFDLVSPDQQPDYCEFSTHPDILSECGINVLLTIEGNSGVETVLNYVQTGSAILADTHPKVDLAHWAMLKDKGVIGYECGTRYGQGIYFPKLPRWGRYNLQGCVMQAVIESQSNLIPLNQHEFDDLAKRSPLISVIERPYNRFTLSHSVSIKKASSLARLFSWFRSLMYVS